MHLINSKVKRVEYNISYYCIERKNNIYFQSIAKENEQTKL